MCDKSKATGGAQHPAASSPVCHGPINTGLGGVEIRVVQTMPETMEKDRFETHGKVKRAV